MGNVASHPVSRSLNHEKVKHAVVNGSSLVWFRFGDRDYESEASEFGNQIGFGGIIIEPSLEIEKVSRAGRLY